MKTSDPSRKADLTLYYFSWPLNSDCTASRKAPKDIISILNKFSAKPIRAFFGSPVQKLHSIIHFILSIKSNSILFLQLPIDLQSLFVYPAIIILKFFKKVKVISLIHDCDEIRDEPFLYPWDKYWKIVRRISDAYISHNDSMTDWLAKNKGISRSSVTPLHLFDYLYEKAFPESGNGIAIAGNLEEKKCPYIYKLKEINGCHWKLFGPNCDTSKCTAKTVEWVGSFDPDDLPQRLNAKFGLVWDGNDVNECTGPFGKYQKYNNPHKLSLYIASGLPVIVWSQAATSRFVQETGIGLSVNSLKDIPKKVSQLSDNDYMKMRNSATAIGKQLRHGDFLTNAINHALQTINMPRLTRD